jgi:4-carboxymuconolactone decarboxylase
VSSERSEQGLRIRRKVLGDEYVDKALKETDDFSRPLQELIIEYGWGVVWTRPGLTLRERSLVNVAALTALGRYNELKSHLRGARINGCTKEEIREVLLQMAVYAGVPAASEGFGIAREVFQDADGKPL